MPLLTYSMPERSSSSLFLHFLLFLLHFFSPPLFPPPTSFTLPLLSPATLILPPPLPPILSPAPLVLHLLVLLHLFVLFLPLYLFVLLLLLLHPVFSFSLRFLVLDYFRRGLRSPLAFCSEREMRPIPRERFVAEWNSGISRPICLGSVGFG